MSTPFTAYPANVPDLTPEQQSCQSFMRGWLSAIAGQEELVKVTPVKTGWGGLQKGRGLVFPSIRIGEKVYANGLAMHTDSEILLEADEDMVRFRSDVGVDRNLWTLTPPIEARMVFSIEAKGQELWRSPEMDLNTPAHPVDLALPPGTRQLTLKATLANDQSRAAHADWAGPTVDLVSGKKVLVGERAYSATPFSFNYGGKPSSELLPKWKQTRSTRPGQKFGSTDHITTWTDPASGLECRFEVTAFDRYPVLEWVLYFRNTGSASTEIISNVNALDLNWQIDAPAAFEPVLARIYRSRGSFAGVEDFDFTMTHLLPTEKIDMEAGTGRSSNNWLPFFNVDLRHMGVITAIGWSGQWECRIDYNKANEIQMTAGMQGTHLRLHPGEEIRTPRIMQLFWQRDRQAGHNLLRRFLLEYHSPHLNGKPVDGPFTIGHWGGMKTQLLLDRINLYKKEGVKMDYVWVDAGWYGLNSTYSPDEFIGDWHQHVGDWRVNPRAHPDGLKPIARAVRDAGMKFLLWVEPERAIMGTKWPEEHPDWFISHETQHNNLLLNLANPAALQGCIELVSGLITEHEIDLYREDFNIEPIHFWRKNDAPDRQGMTEIGCVTGVYKFWDALLERHPGLVIDNCSSGGRRIDLETISRSIALWRSDYQCAPDRDVIANQGQCLALQYWLPLHGTGTWANKTYTGRVGNYRIRSSYGPAFQLSNFVRESTPIQDDYPWDYFRKMCAEYLRVRPYFAGDFYPLLEVDFSPAKWVVYQMDRPDLAGGFVMALRRQEAPWDRGSFKLQHLDESATYELEDADTGKVRELSGKALSQGLEIVLPEAQSSALFFYRKK